MAIMDDILAVMKYVGGLSPQNVRRAQAEGAKFRNAPVLQGDASNPGTVLTMLRRLGKNGKGIAGARGVLKMEGMDNAGKDIGVFGGNMAEMDPARAVNMAQTFDAKKAARTYASLAENALPGQMKLPNAGVATTGGQVSLNDMVRAMTQNADGMKGQRAAQELDTIVRFLSTYAKGSKLK
jgi:hypothetical protein